MVLDYLKNVWNSFFKNCRSQDENDRPKYSCIERIQIQRKPWKSFVRLRRSKCIVFAIGLYGIPTFVFFLLEGNHGHLNFTPMIIGLCFSVSLIITSIIFFFRYLTNFPPFLASKDGKERYHSSNDSRCLCCIKCCRKLKASTQPLASTQQPNEPEQAVPLTSSNAQPAGSSLARADINSACVNSPTDGIKMQKMGTTAAEVYDDTSGLSLIAVTVIELSETTDSTSTCGNPTSAAISPHEADAGVMAFIAIDINTDDSVEVPTNTSPLLDSASADRSSGMTGRRQFP